MKANRKQKIFFIIWRSEGPGGKEERIWSFDISRAKRNQIRSNLPSVDWHPSLSDDIKFENIKRSKCFGGCWRISLGKENLSSDFEGPYLEKYWRDIHMWRMVYLIRFPSFIWHMISTKRKISKFWGFYFETGRGKKTQAKKKFEKENSREPRVRNWLSLSLYPSLPSSAKYKKIKNEKTFWGCWRISLGKENFSWVFEGLYLKKYLWGSRES